MVIASRGQTAVVHTVTAGIDVALHHDDVAMHVPVATAEKARRAAAEHGLDLLVSVGGGSATSLAKAIALTSGLPIAPGVRCGGPTVLLVKRLDGAGCPRRARAIHRFDRIACRCAGWS